MKDVAFLKEQFSEICQQNIFLKQIYNELSCHVQSLLNIKKSNGIQSKADSMKTEEQNRVFNLVERKLSGFKRLEPEQSHCFTMCL